jgi:hypothetical protein
MANITYNTLPLNEAQYGSRCSVPPVQTVKVPQVKHIVHRKPVVQETITEEVSYIEVPITHFYELRDYPQQVIAPSCPVQQRPCAPVQKPPTTCGC